MRRTDNQVLRTTISPRRVRTSSPTTTHACALTWAGHALRTTLCFAKSPMVTRAPASSAALNHLDASVILFLQPSSTLVKNHSQLVALHQVGDALQCEDEIVSTLHLALRTQGRQSIWSCAVSSTCKVSKPFGFRHSYYGISTRPAPPTTHTVLCILLSMVGSDPPPEIPCKRRLALFAHIRERDRAFFFNFSDQNVSGSSCFST